MGHPSALLFPEWNRTPPISEQTFRTSNSTFELSSHLFLRRRNPCVTKILRDPDPPAIPSEFATLEIGKEIKQVLCLPEWRTRRDETRAGPTIFEFIR